MGLIRVAGVDPSLRNTGLVIADVNTETNRISEITGMHLLRTEPSKVKSQRKSSADYQAASTIANALRDYIREYEVRLVFAECPSGAQSARASFALGISLGIIASVQPAPIEVTPAQTKTHSVGIRTATKSEMIEWAVGMYPDADWLMRGDRILNSNEHLADAVGVIHAGLVSPEWGSVKNLLKR